MKLTEIFDRSGVETDEKARRVLNTSEAVANISAGEVEDGVTIERIESIGVPVYRYNTQITIHGELPGFNEEARPAGFRSIFRNANGTVGVRYVAIDAAKKTLIAKAAHYGTRQWAANISSEGLSVYKSFESRDDCVAAFKAFPRELIYGGVMAGVGAYGGYYVVAYVGAIPESNVWPFILRLWGVADQAQIDAEQAVKDAKWAADSALRNADIAKRKQAKDAQRKEIASRMATPKITALPKGAGQFIRISSGSCGGEVTQQLYMFRKRGPALCYAVKSRTDTIEPSKWHKIEPRHLAMWAEDLAGGFLFATA